MNREERIERARRIAAQGAPTAEDELKKTTQRLYQRLSGVGASQADRHVEATLRSGTRTLINPTDAPREWTKAIELARALTAQRARRRDKITYGELQWAILDELRALVDPESMVELLLTISREPEGVLLAAIAVDAATGEPSDDFLLEAMELGFDDPPSALQRQAFEAFR